MARSSWIPNQHGAWAMLVTPVAVGALFATVRPLHLVLLLAWLSAYCANFYLSLAMKTKRWTRYRQQLLVYSGVAASCGVPLLMAQPELLRIGFVAVPTFLVNIYYVRERNERSWVNDLAGIALAFAVGFGAFRLGYAADDHALIERAWRGIGIVSLYFVGTVFYVKTMIRERGVALWLRLSIGFHVALVLLLAVMQWWLLTGVAIAALVRAALVPRRSWTPKQVGMFELLFTVAFAVGVLR